MKSVPSLRRLPALALLLVGPMAGGPAPAGGFQGLSGQTTSRVSHEEVGLTKEPGTVIPAGDVLPAPGVDLQELRFTSPAVARSLEKLARSRRHTGACLFARHEISREARRYGKTFWKVFAVLETAADPAVACAAPGERGMAIFVREKRPNPDRWLEDILRLLAQRPDLGFIVAVTHFRFRLDGASRIPLPIPDGPAVFKLTSRGAEAPGRP